MGEFPFPVLWRQIQDVVDQKVVIYQWFAETYKFILEIRATDNYLTNKHLICRKFIVSLKVIKLAGTVCGYIQKALVYITDITVLIFFIANFCLV